MPPCLIANHCTLWHISNVSLLLAIVLTSVHGYMRHLSEPTIVETCDDVQCSEGYVCKEMRAECQEFDEECVPVTTECGLGTWLT